ncbi:MAG: CvpA family protein [Synergistaceae bacterium]|jgi:uncharacterized membrane protein required for colicin V production|nr:CvpA family protein [Synergistaceae bacterium]
MSVIDIIMLFIGIFFIARGVFRGLSGEIISLFGTVGGFVCAIKFYGPLENILMERLGASVLVATIASMLAIFFVIFFGCSLLETGVKKVISKTSLTSADKFLGACAGVVKLYIITLFVLVGGAILAPVTGGAWDAALARSRVMAITMFTWPLVSPPLERAGLMPDIGAIQDRARDYLTRQAGRALQDGASEDVSDPVPERAIPTSSGDGVMDADIGQ